MTRLLIALTAVLGVLLAGCGSSAPPLAEQSDTGKRRATGTEIPDGYRVKSGDTLGKLAKQFDVEGGFTAIAKANHISNPDRIYVGQILN